MLALAKRQGRLCLEKIRGSRIRIGPEFPGKIPDGRDNRVKDWRDEKLAKRWKEGMSEKLREELEDKLEDKMKEKFLNKFLKRIRGGYPPNRMGIFKEIAINP